MALHDETNVALLLWAFTALLVVLAVVEGLSVASGLATPTEAVSSVVLPLLYATAAGSVVVFSQYRAVVLADLRGFVGLVLPGEYDHVPEGVATGVLRFAGTGLGLVGTVGVFVFLEVGSTWAFTAGGTSLADILGVDAFFGVGPGESIVLFVVGWLLRVVAWVAS